MSVRLSGGQRMGNTDALMWRLERSPLLRSTIVQVALLDRSPDPERLRAKALHGTGQIKRFRQVPVAGSVPGTAPTWAAAADFDIDYHLRFSRLSGTADLRALLDEAALIAMQAFDPARPLWESHIIDGLDGSGAAAVQKIHHAMGDGVSLLDIAMLFVDLERDALPPSGDEVEPVPAFGSVFERVGASLTNDLLALRRASSFAPDAIHTVVRNPGHTAASLLALGRSVARMMAPGSGPLSPIMLGRSLGARFDILTVSFDELRSAAKRVGGKLNTSYLAGVAGGLCRYHELHGTRSSSVRCAMPVNTRDAADESLGNQFSPTRFHLPIDIDDPIERMEATRDLTTSQSSEPALSLAAPVARALNAVPPAILVPAFEYVMRGIDVIVSSVPGSPIPLYVAGARSLGNFGFSPRSGAALNITMISHLNELNLAVNSDPVAIPDPDVMMACMRDSFDEICKLG